MATNASSTSTPPGSKPWSLPKQKEYILTNASIVDPLDGSLQHNMTVILRDGLIKHVLVPDEFVSWLSTFRPTSNTITVDLAGKYLCPGLIDCHVHVATPPGESGLAATMAVDPNTSLLRQPWLLRRMLNRGFTTVRDCGGASLALQTAVAEGLHPGPRMFIAGKAISQTGGHGDGRSALTPESSGDCCGGHAAGIGRIADGVEACLTAAREQLRQGADFIKIMASGGVASPTDKLTSVQYTDEEVSAITRVAAAAGTYVTAHAYTPASIQHAIKNGVMGIEHGNLLDQETAELMAARGVFLTPTLTTYDAMASREFAGFLPPGNAEKNLQVLDAGLRSIQIADAAGVTLLYGSDLLGNLETRQTREFVLRQKVQRPLKVLQAATVNGARRLGMDGKLGRVKDGYVADLVVVGRDPLGDVGVFDEERGVEVVIKEGRVAMSRLQGLVVEM